MENKYGVKIEVQIESMSRHMQLNHKAQIIKIEDSRESVINLSFGITKVSFPDKPDIHYYGLEIKGFGERPMMVLTYKKVDIYDSKSIYQIIQIYLTRWNCDECSRYIKRSYIENVFVRSYVDISNMTELVNAIAYFTCMYIA